MTTATTDPLSIGVIVGSTRPGRRAEAVARWVYEQAAPRTDATLEIIDLAEVGLPLLDEPKPAIFGDHARPHTRAWARIVAAHDAFVFITPEYNHSTSAALKNALDYLYTEWNDKAAGFVAYGFDAGGARAVEHLRQIVGELQMASVESHVLLSLSDDFNDGTPVPSDRAATQLASMLDQLTAWGTALRTMRTATAAA